ncbi:hypothetical protein [Streptomyces sp. UNOC14_S4]|uniref:hypothetical protein n=1 Tax=Streptomyces sp. UNOC14_S4 TaxID=2872340 RepID=UPI001E308167|nr:hypothetical protein [Streptomyces sp. UNOC14_S4]MCC3766448.1 hypothetical protein [Streptomyces sp. UNOC14_S4]
MRPPDGSCVIRNYLGRRLRNGIGVFVDRSVFLALPETWPVTVTVEFSLLVSPPYFPSDIREIDLDENGELRVQLADMPDLHFSLTSWRNCPDGKSCRVGLATGEHIDRAGGTEPHTYIAYWQVRPVLYNDGVKMVASPIPLRRAGHCTAILDMAACHGAHQVRELTSFCNAAPDEGR